MSSEHGTCSAVRNAQPLREIGLASKPDTAIFSFEVGPFIGGSLETSSPGPDVMLAAPRAGFVPGLLLSRPNGAPIGLPDDILVHQSRRPHA